MRYLPKLKLTTLFIFLCGFAFMAAFGFWWLMATITAFYLITRLLGAFFRFTGSFLSTSWSILNWRGPLSRHPFLAKDIKHLLK